MKLKTITILTIIALVAMAGCGTSAADLATQVSAPGEPQAQASTSVQANPSSKGTSSATPTVDIESLSNLQAHEEESDYGWDAADEVAITLADNACQAGSEAVRIEGNLVSILAAGTYRLSGSLSDGQILVSTDSDEPVRLILDGVNITNSTSAAITIEDAAKVIIILPANSENHLADASTYVYPSTTVDEPNAALFSKADMTITGPGSLIVQGNSNDGITSKDGLLIRDATISVVAADDGIRGKDYLVISDSTLTLETGGDGLKSDNDKEDALGTIQIIGGTLTISADGDAISAEGLVEITSGNFNLRTVNGSTSPVADDSSAKGIKGLAAIIIHDGVFAIDSADDAVHSNGTIAVEGGNFQIASGDDGMHADTSLTVNAADILISASYEGLESQVVTINGGTIHIRASDDGINGAGGTDASGFGGMAWGQPGGGQGGVPGGRPGEQFAGGMGSSDIWFYMNGGYVYVNADGDGVDVNGSISMTGGTLLVDGPTNDGNGAIDYDQSFVITGGTLIAAGSAGMAQTPSADSTQASILFVLDQAPSAGTLFDLQTGSGDNLLAYAPAKQYQSVLVSSPKLTVGSAYNAYLGGSMAGTATDGLYADGTYSGGSLLAAINLTSTVNSSGSFGGFGGRR